MLRLNQSESVELFEKQVSLLESLEPAAHVSVACQASALLMRERTNETIRLAGGPGGAKGEQPLAHRGQIKRLCAFGPCGGGEIGIVIGGKQPAGIQLQESPGRRVQAREPRCGRTGSRTPKFWVGLQDAAGRGDRIVIHTFTLAPALELIARVAPKPFGQIAGLLELQLIALA